MRSFIISAACIVLACGAAFSQESMTKFEVASVKPAALQKSNFMRISGGPGTADPGRLTWNNVTPQALLLRAYGLKSYQLSGPSWLDSARVDILAKVPPGATKDQINIMLQDVLVERFNPTFHREAKERSIYELTLGKNGSKLKESDLSIQPPVREPGQLFRGGADKDGFPTAAPGTNAKLGRTVDGIDYWTYQKAPIPDLAAQLEAEFARPVIDKTGLTGKYDFTLMYSRDGLRVRKLDQTSNSAPADPSGGPTLLKAIEDQLGLKLESAKDSIDVLVIDHIDKTPTEN